MPEPFVPPTSRAELLSRMALGWQSLQAAFDQVPQAIASIPGADGWSAQDQVAHITAWERSLTALLRGESRAAALGVPEALFASHDFDAINAIVRDRMAAWSRADVVAEARAAHAALVATLTPLTWDDLHRPRSYDQPNLADPDEHPEVINWVYGDTIDHYPEHQTSLEQTVAQLSTTRRQDLTRPSGGTG